MPRVSSRQTRVCSHQSGLMMNLTNACGAPCRGMHQAGHHVRFWPSQGRLLLSDHDLVTVGTERRVVTGNLKAASWEMTWATVNCALLRSWGDSRGPLKALHGSNEDLHLGLTDLQVMRALALRTQRPSRHSVLRSARLKEECPE
jgi:hypothetical protein